MKLMNSDTHSCTHSFASLLTLADPGSAFFMIRATFAIYLCSASTTKRVTEGLGRRGVTYRQEPILFPELLDLGIGEVQRYLRGVC